MTTPTEDSWKEDFQELIHPLGRECVLALVPKHDRSAKIWLTENYEDEVIKFISTLLASQNASLRQKIERLFCDDHISGIVALAAHNTAIQKVLALFPPLEGEGK